VLTLALWWIAASRERFRPLLNAASNAWNRKERKAAESAKEGKQKQDGTEKIFFCDYSRRNL
jgi:hypothetical protein